VYGIADLIYVIWAIVCLLALLSIYFIIKKHPYGIYSLYTYFAINVAIFILGSVLEFIDIDTAREIFTQSREMRWLNTDNVNIVISPVWISIFWVIYLAFYAWLARYVYTTESYFQIQKKNPRI
jgi:divalent metal cation (Fe/Co/Zn/Cd) transporter